VHGTAVAINGKGVLITGQAGSGKTTLALELIRRCRTAHIPAGLVADDRTIIAERDGALVLRCPAPLVGKIELRGFGIADANAIAAEQADLALVVDPVAPSNAVRFAEGKTVTLSGRDIACLAVPEGPPPSAAGAVFAALGMQLWI